MHATESIDPSVGRTPPGRRFTNSTESYSSGGIGREKGSALPPPRSNSSSRSSPLAATRTASSTPTTTRQPPVVSLLEVSSRPFSRSWGTGGGGGGGSSGAKGGARWGRNVGAESTAIPEGGKTYHCQICLDDRPAGAGFVLSACGHVFCRVCLKAFVTSKINDAEVYPACFHVAQGFQREKEGVPVDDSSEGGGAGREAAAGRGRGRGGGDLERAGGGGGRRGVDTGRQRWQQQQQQQRQQPKGEPEGCGVVLSPSDIKELIKADAGTSRKYSRFLFSREHKTARECPRCSKMSVGDPSTSLEMRCSGCGMVFCYEHGGAHEGKTCAHYVASTADETHRTMALIGRITKPCPGCRTPVEKLGGCNQMVCLHCNSSFCWICMEQVDRGTFPVHFQWWNVRGCPNQQLQEDSQQSPRSRRCLKVLSILQIVVVGPFALLLTLASSVACVCCLPAFRLPPRQLFTGCISGWGNFVMMLPILPFISAGAVLAGLVYIIMLPARLFTAISRKCSSGRTGCDLPSSRNSSDSHHRARSSSSNSSRSGGRSAARRGGATVRGDDGGQNGEAGTGDTEPGAPQSGTINAVHLDLESGSRVVVSTAAEATTNTTSPPGGASALAILSEVLRPQLLRGGQEDHREEEQRQQREEEEGRRTQEEGPVQDEEEEEGEKEEEDDDDEEAAGRREGRRHQGPPHPSTSPPRSWMPSPFNQHNGGGGSGCGGGGGASGEGGDLALPLPPEISPVSEPIPSPMSSISPVAPAAVAVPARSERSSRNIEGSGGGGGGSDDEVSTAPSSSPGTRETVERWLGGSPPMAAVSSPSFDLAGSTAGLRSAATREDSGGDGDTEGVCA